MNLVNRDNQVFHDGFMEQERGCPNTAVLMIFPRFREVFITSPSCEFLCTSKGGPEVVAATLAGLDRGGVEEAILAGIKGASSGQKVTFESRHGYQRINHAENLMKSDATWVWTMRLWYVLVLCLALVSIVAFVYYVVLPQKATSYRSSFSAMTSASARRDIHRAYMDAY